jgi:hypothetical protein
MRSRWTRAARRGFSRTGALWFAIRLPALRRAVRPIYAELGILAPLPPVPEP